MFLILAGLININIYYSIKSNKYTVKIILINNVNIRMTSDFLIKCLKMFGFRKYIELLIM